MDMSAFLKHFSDLRTKMTILQASHHRLASRVDDMQMQPRNEVNLPTIEEKQKPPTLANIVSGKAINKSNASSSEISKTTTQYRKQEIPVQEEVISDDNGSSNPSEDHPLSDVEDFLNQEWKLQRHQIKKRQSLEKRKRGIEHEGVVRNNPFSSSSHRYMKKRKPAVIGNGSTYNATSLCAASPRRDIQLFISRLKVNVTSDDLKTHITDISKTNDIDCEIQEQKHNSYISYKVSVRNIEKNIIPNMYMPENWPTGILVKRWYQS